MWSFSISIALIIAVYIVCFAWYYRSLLLYYGSVDVRAVDLSVRLLAGTRKEREMSVERQPTAHLPLFSRRKYFSCVLTIFILLAAFHFACIHLTIVKITFDIQLHRILLLNIQVHKIYWCEYYLHSTVRALKHFEMQSKINTPKKTASNLI